MPKIVEQAAWALNYDLWYEPLESAIVTYGDGTLTTFYENLTGKDWSNSFAQPDCPTCRSQAVPIDILVGIPTKPTTSDLWSIVEVWLETLPGTVYVDPDGDCCICDRADDFCYCESMADMDYEADEDGNFPPCSYCDGDMQVYEVNIAKAVLPKEVYSQYF